MWNQVIIVCSKCSNRGRSKCSVSQRGEGLIWAKNSRVKASSMAAEELNQTDWVQVVARSVCSWGMLGELLFFTKTHFLILAKVGDKPLLLSRVTMRVTP